MNRLLTVVHISDLHFGSVDPQTMDAEIPLLCRVCPGLFDGLQGHCYRVATQLDRFFGLLAHEAPLLVVTGDITACGGKDEYSTARAYLASELDPPSGNYVGLRCPTWNRHSVSGNHDNWPGKRTVLGPRLECRDETFRSMPFSEQHVVELRNGYTISFLGIDTDADVRHSGWQRFSAQGAFLSQLEKLAKKLAAPAEKEVRLLLLHHSTQYRSRLPIMRISETSKAALDRFVAEHNVRILLCGHVHIPKITCFEVPMGRGHIVLEARCGATIKKTLDAVNRARAGPESCPNSLLVHRMFADECRIVWQTHLFVNYGAGFQEHERSRREIGWPA
jgi:3',5'-cyclic AMP phosphodiesterase CpdA